MIEQLLDWITGNSNIGGNESLDVFDLYFVVTDLDGHKPLDPQNAHERAAYNAHKMHGNITGGCGTIGNPNVPLGKQQG